MQQYRKNLGKVSLTSEGAWNLNNSYDILSIVYDEHTQHGFISRKVVPQGVDIYNKEYWMPLNVSGYADNNVIILSKKTSEASIQSYTLEEAITSIKSVGRRPGAILGFYNENSDRLDIGGRWEIWQFNSTTISEWEDVKSWTNIYYNYNKFVGWYKSEDYLKKHFPFPEIGCYAFVGNELNEASVYRCDNKYVWINTTQHAWDYIKVVVQGNVTVGENGNWFNNGVDTGIPASIKGENGKTPIIRNNNNILEVSYDNVNWIRVSDEMAAWFRINNNKLEMSRHEAVGWEVMSDYIAAWFRWQSNGGQQVNSTGKIQITRDGITWTDLSGEFINNLRISRYIGADESLPISGIAEGTIYAKGPTYADGDTSHSNPIYRLWVYAWKDNTLAWQDNGEFTSIAAGVVQKTGNSETEVMSQKAVTEKLSELDSIKGNELSILSYKPGYISLETNAYYNPGGFGVNIYDISKVKGKNLIIKYYGVSTKYYGIGFTTDETLGNITHGVMPYIQGKGEQLVYIPNGATYMAVYKNTNVFEVYNEHPNTEDSKTEIPYTSVIQNKYIRGDNGGELYQINGYSIKSYPVKAGDKILLDRQAFGNYEVFCLCGFSSDGKTLDKGYIRETDSIKSNVVVIPDNVNYIMINSGRVNIYKLISSQHNEKSTFKSDELLGIKYINAYPRADTGVIQEGGSFYSKVIDVTEESDVLIEYYNINAQYYSVAFSNDITFKSITHGLIPYGESSGIKKISIPEGVSYMMVLTTTKVHRISYNINYDRTYLNTIKYAKSIPLYKILSGKYLCSWQNNFMYDAGGDTFNINIHNVEGISKIYAFHKGFGGNYIYFSLVGFGTTPDAVDKGVITIVNSSENFAVVNVPEGANYAFVNAGTIFGELVNFDSSKLSKKRVCCCVGDSITQGQGGLEEPRSGVINSHNSYTDILLRINSDFDFVNYGYGGNKISDIFCSMGWDNIVCGQDFILKGDCTFSNINNEEPLLSNFGGEVVSSLLSQYRGTASKNAQTNCEVSGVQCNINRTSDGILQIARKESVSYDLNIDKGSFINFGGAKDEDSFYVIFVGRNSFSIYSDTEEYISIISNAVKNIQGGKYLILGLYTAKTSEVSAIEQTNKQLSRVFGNKFIDLHKAFTSENLFKTLDYEPTSDSEISDERKSKGVYSDIYGIQNKVLPSSYWRYSYINELSIDNIHLSNLGYKGIAHLVNERLKLLFGD